MKTFGLSRWGAVIAALSLGLGSTSVLAAPGAPTPPPAAPASNPSGPDAQNQAVDNARDNAKTFSAASGKKMLATPDQVADAKAQIAAAGLACNLVNVRFEGTGKNKVNGKDVDLSGYEIACDDGTGYSLTGVKGGSPETTAASCLALDTQKKILKEKAKFQTCTLPENKNLLGEAQAYVDHAGLNSCKVDKADYFGASKTNKDVFYEVSCGGTTSYVLRVIAGAGDKVQTINCLKAAAQGLVCKLTPAEAQRAPVIAIAATAGKACDINNARYVVTDPKNGDEYYEVGCAGGKPGYMAVVTTAGALSRSVDCAAAAGIAGGCTLTDAKTLQAAVNDNMQGRLKAAGIACAYSQARSIGQAGAHHQDVIEYNCSDHPKGLVVMFPTADGGKLEQYDCISVAHFATKCEYVTKETLLAELTKTLAAANRTCKVADYSYLGTADENSYELELTCTGGPGLVAEFVREPAKLKVATTCAVAAKQGVPCSLPGNQ